MRKLTMGEVTFEVRVEQDDTPLKGNVLASGDDQVDAEAEADVQEALDRCNIWAWASVTVVAHWNGFEGRDHLGCCSHDDEEGFRQSGYLEDLKNGALDDLNRRIAETAKRLLPLTEEEAE